MVHPEIAKYLEQNKGAYPIEKLREKLLAAGYPPEQVEEGIRFLTRSRQTFGSRFFEFIGGFVGVAILYWLEYILFLGYGSPLRFIVGYGFEGIALFFLVNLAVVIVFLRRKSRALLWGAGIGLFSPALLLVLILLLFLGW